MTATVHLEIDRGVAFLTMENPPLNIITAEMRPHFIAALETIRRTPSVRAAVLTGAGDRSFCAGADLSEEADLTPNTVRQFIDDDCEIFDGLERLQIPVIAAINGHCMGGGFEVALSCDLRVVADDAKLCAPGVKVGLVVSTTRLTRLVGHGVASDVILTGRTFFGDEAYRLGIATRHVKRSQVLEAAQELAAEIASRAPLAVSHAKRSIREAIELPYADAMEAELQHFAQLSSTSDHKEAIKAFFDKRPPTFSSE